MGERDWERRVGVGGSVKDECGNEEFENVRVRDERTKR
jgi:hypothetical protein